MVIPCLGACCAAADSESVYILHPVKRTLVIETKENKTKASYEKLCSVCDQARFLPAALVAHGEI